MLRIILKNVLKEKTTMPNKLSIHDRLTRSLMSNPKVAEEFFKENLPEKIKNAVDFSSLNLRKESFVDDKLRLQTADLLYSVKFNNEPGFLYILFEHSSSSQDLLPFRMIKYMLAIMEDHMKAMGTRTLPLVYPIILYNGKKPYAHSLDLFDLFHKDERDLARETLMSPCRLIDLTKVSDEELLKFLWFGTMALAMKHVHDPDIAPFFQQTLIHLLKELEKQGEAEYIYTIITYIAEGGKMENRTDITKAIKELKSLDEEKIMGTLAEYWAPEITKVIEKRATERATEKAEEKAAKARHKRDIESAKFMLAKGIDLDIIAEVTQLSREQLKRMLP